jgi:hypothetical protein
MGIVMKLLIALLPLAYFILWLLVISTKRPAHMPSIAPEPTPKTSCPHCYEKHDGPFILCEACRWACYPDEEVSEQMKRHVDEVHYWTGR